MSLYNVRKYARQIQNAVSGYSNLENLIREATNTDSWGPTTEQKKQLTSWILNYSASGLSEFNDMDLSTNVDPEYTHKIGQYTVDFIVKRIKEYTQHSDNLYTKLKKNLVTKGYEFQIVAKCLNLLEYLLVNCVRRRGHRVIYDIADDMRMYVGSIKALKGYHVKIAYDGLIMVHEKQLHQLSSRLVTLLEDEDALSEERTKMGVASRKVEAQSTSMIMMDESYNRPSSSSSHRRSTSSATGHKDPFGHSRMGSLTNAVGRMGSLRQKKEKRISLDEATSSRRGGARRRFDSEVYDDYDDFESSSSSRSRKPSPPKQPKQEEVVVPNLLDFDDEPEPAKPQPKVSTMPGSFIQPAATSPVENVTSKMNALNLDWSAPKNPAVPAKLGSLDWSSSEPKKTETVKKSAPAWTIPTTTTTTTTTTSTQSSQPTPANLNWEAKVKPTSPIVQSGSANQEWGSSWSQPAKQPEWKIESPKDPKPATNKKNDPFAGLDNPWA